MADAYFHKAFQKYPKIHLLGHRSTYGILTTPGRICVQEKVDGANFGFYVKDGVIYFCSHNQNLTDSVQIEETGIPLQWKGVEPVMESFTRDPSAFNESIYVYGESTQSHRIKYDDIPGFIGYDVMHIDTGTFMHWSWAKNIVEGMGLPFINTICELYVPDDIDYTQDGVEHIKSLYKNSAYRNGSAEGVVLKRYDTQQFAKVRDPAFDEKAPRMRKIIDSEKEQAIADVYATPARIEKKIYELRDEGNEVDMPMMRELFARVVDDILEEEGEEIEQEYGDFNIKTLGSVVSKKCAQVLKVVIIRGGNR